MKAHPTNPVSCLLALLFAVGAPAAMAVDIPVTGLPVPELAGIDNAVVQVMDGNGIAGCTVGVMKAGRVIYQRGFGWRDQGTTQPMPENATMRLASVSKVFVKEAILKLIDDELLEENTKVFHLAGEEGGILDLDPWPVCQDPRVGDITVKQLMDMRVYWAEDYVWNSIEIYEAMGLGGNQGYPPPVSLEDMTRYALGQTMLLDPGTSINAWPDDFVAPYDGYPYSNFGYNVLVLVIEAVTGQDFYSYLRQHLMTRNMWIPTTDFFPAQPFNTQGLREPHYFSGLSWPNLYDPNWPTVPAPYGGYNVEAMYGSSFLNSSIAPLLTYTENYGTRWIGNMPGSSAYIRDSASNNDVRIAVICNDTMSGDEAAEVIGLAVDNVIGNGVLWPTKRIDGQWIDWLEPTPSAGDGSYDVPFGSLGWALTNSTWGTKLQFRPGDHPFTGVLNKKLRLKAPLGAAKIGKNGP